MFIRSLSTALVLCAVFVTGCATAPKVRIDKDPTADLGSYKTFGFIERPATDHGPYSTLMTTRLRQATRTQLEQLGYTYDEQAPQLKVNFFLNVADRQELRTSPAPGGFYGYRRGIYRSWTGDLETVQYKAGTLGVDLVDASKNALVWQGLAEGKVSAEASRKPDEAIDRVVAQIFERFPKS